MSFEHFRPKNQHPNEAYEWGNYRLVCGTLNGRKGVKEILDPFDVEDDWFQICFPSLVVKPGSGLEGNRRNDVVKTIKILGLNDDATCLKGRYDYVRDYCQGHITFDFFQRRSPFIARELDRQGLRTRITRMMVFA